MGKPFKCALVGGDGRQILLGRLLEQEGFPVTRFALPEGEKHLEGALAEAGCVLLPLPVEREGLLNAPLCNEHKWPMEQILEAIPRGTLVLGGQVSAHLQKLGEQQGLRLVDYGAREDFLCRNAAITAEGALQLAMGHHQESLGDTRCLVLGSGRCGTVRHHPALGVGQAAGSQSPGPGGGVLCPGYTGGRAEGGRGDFQHRARSSDRRGPGRASGERQPVSGIGRKPRGGWIFRPGVFSNRGEMWYSERQKILTIIKEGEISSC